MGKMFSNTQENTLHHDDQTNVPTHQEFEAGEFSMVPSVTPEYRLTDGEKKARERRAV